MYEGSWGSGAFWDLLSYWGLQGPFWCLLGHIRAYWGLLAYLGLLERPVDLVGPSTAFLGLLATVHFVLAASYFATDFRNSHKHDFDILPKACNDSDMYILP